MARFTSIASAIWRSERISKKKSKPCSTRKRKPPKRKRSKRKRARKTKKKSRTRKRNLPNPETRPKAWKELPDEPDNPDESFGSKENSRAIYRPAPCRSSGTPSIGAARTGCVRDQKWKDLYDGGT